MPTTQVTVNLDAITPAYQPKPTIVGQPGNEFGFVHLADGASIMSRSPARLRAAGRALMDAAKDLSQRTGVPS